MRVALVIPQSNYPYATPCLELIPQGPAYIAGILKDRGHEVFGVCTNHDPELESGPATLRRLLSKTIKEAQPDVVALGAMAAEYLFLRDSIQIIREIAPDTPIVLGGSIMTNDKTAFELLQPDFGVMDEGEIPLIELLQCIEKNNPLETVENIAYWKDGAAHYNKLRTANYDLDDLPYPDYEPLQIRQSFSLANQTDNNFYVRMEKRPRLLPISSGRSCPFKCTFCQYSVLEGSRRKYRGRSMQSVVEEAKHFYELYQFNILKIYDDLFSVHEDRILEFCELMRAAKLPIHWDATMRVGDVTSKLLHEMKSAGCIQIGYGFESADDSVLTSMNKRISREQIAKAIRLTEEAELGIQANFIYGDPEETEASIETTRNFYMSMCTDHIVHHDYIMPYPGSPIFDHSMQKGVIKSKEDYYLSVHLRPRYNMTKLDDATFISAIEPIVETKLTGSKFALNQQLQHGPRDEFKHPYFDSRWIIHSQSQCPHCFKEVNNIFPIQKRNIHTWSEQISLLEPIRAYCDGCHKRMLISLLSLANLEESLSSFIHKVNQLVENNTATILAPAIGYTTIDCCVARGLNFEALNVRAFMQKTAFITGMRLHGAQVLPIDEQTVQRNRNFHYVVMPDPTADQIAGDLLRLGVPETQLITPFEPIFPTAISNSTTQRLAKNAKRAIPTTVKNKIRPYLERFLH